MFIFNLEYSDLKSIFLRKTYLFLLDDFEHSVMKMVEYDLIENKEISSLTIIKTIPSGHFNSLRGEIFHIGNLEIYYVTYKLSPIYMFNINGSFTELANVPFEKELSSKDCKILARESEV